MTLDAFFQTNPRTALAFSGGVDSAYLLWAGVQAGTEVQPYFVKTPFQPQFELEDARRLCGQAGVELVVLDYDILSDGTVAANPPDRCYHCKKRLFSLLKERALRELEVRSPLRECGLTKERIRVLSRQAGLFTWDKPSYACLATRVPTGRTITPEDLERVETGEAALAALGFRDFRLRLAAEGCRLQLVEEQFSLLPERRAELLSALEPLFSQITLDLRPRAPID